jgi:TonB-dependent starch-binding outer membrane protein SusC
MKNEAMRILAKKSHLRLTAKSLLVGVFLLVQLSALAQERTISGTVTGTDGVPLGGVAVTVKGTTVGTNSGTDGKFTLSIPASAQTLSFSFIGMETKLLPIDSGNVYDAILSQSTIGLDEVVVTGYGTQKKSDLTGSVVRVNMDQKASIANVTIAGALQGVTAGVNVGGVSTAGEVAELSIRGKTSLSATDEPLIVLDGIIYNGSIADIDIDDVESIDILKDASAAAVYGSRSANGVMIISTKRGKSEKPVISINTYYGFQDFTNSPEKVMDGDQFAVRLVDFYYQQDLYAWYATNPTSDAGKPVRGDIKDRNYVASFLRTQEEKENYLAHKYVDWMKEVEQPAPIQNYHISVSGKSNKTNYYISGSYTGEKGRLMNDQFKRTTILTNLDNKLTDWLTIGLNSSYSYRDYSGLPATIGGGFLEGSMYASPLVAVKDANGNYPMMLAQEVVHPMQNTVCDNLDLRKNFMITGYARIQIPQIKGLSYEFNYSNTFYTTSDATFYPSASTTTGNANKGFAEKNYSDNTSWIYNNIVTYSRTFANNHSVNATFLYSRENGTGKSSTLTASGFDNELLGYNGMELGTTQTVNTGGWEQNSLSYMARLNYSFKSKYLFTGTVRKDGFSGFGANNKTATFPSVSLGWVISEEGFLKDLTTINFLKLRTSVGQNGNQGIGRYSSFSKMSSDQPYIFGNSTAIGIYPSSLGNADLGWESTLSYNLGIDFGILKNRISGSVDMYTAQTSNVLVSRALPGSTGYTSVWTNIGGIDNKGIEFSLTTVNIDKILRWESKFVFSLNRDKITKLYGGAEDRDVGNGWFVGEPISAIYDYDATGAIWTEKEFYDGKITILDTYPGHLKIVDQNNDGDLDPDNDRTIVGYKTPNYRFSIYNSFSYKNFTFSFFLNSIMGGNGYYQADNGRAILSCYSTPGSGDAGIQYVYRSNVVATRQYWTPDNGVTDAPSLYFLPRRVAGFYQDRSFIRLQDISLSYKFGKNALNTLGLDGLQIYVSGKNLYTWTKWQGWDPEMMDSDYTRMMRNIIAGIRLTF